MWPPANTITISAAPIATGAIALPEATAPPMVNTRKCSDKFSNEFLHEVRFASKIKFL